MSNLNRFLKENKIKKENVQYAATKSLTDEDGKPLLWEIKALTSKETNKITEDCTIQEQIPGKPNMFRNKIDSTKLLTKRESSANLLSTAFSFHLETPSSSHASD